MKTHIWIIAIAGMLAALPAWALDLQEARKQGLVGEATDGYVVAIKSSSEAMDLARDVNAKRKMEYLRISKENGQPVDVVAKVAAEEIINGLPKGSMYQDNEGNWKMR